jgi:hypothetical protein
MEGEARRSEAWLLLASCAITYPAFLLASLIQMVLPALAGAWSGTLLLEDVRLTPLWLAAWGYPGDTGARWLLRYGPLVFGGVAAAVAILAARRARPVLALLLLHCALWNAVLLLGSRRPGEAAAQTAVAAAILLLAVRGLVERSAAGRRWEAAAIAFLAPVTVFLVVFWRVLQRLPFRGPVSGAALLSVAALLVGAALLGVWLARPTAAASVWTGRRALASSALALSALAAMLSYGQLRETILDSRLARWTTEHYEIRYPPSAYAPDAVRNFTEQREKRYPELLARVGGSAAKLRVFLFPTHEAIFARTGSTAPYTVRGADVFAVVNQQISEVDLRADARALLHHAWGAAPANSFLQQAAAALVAGAPPAGARITYEEGPYPLSQLSDGERFVSPFVREALAAEFAAWIGPERLRRLYTGQDTRGDWRAPLESGWRQHLLAQAKAWKPAAARPPDPGRFFKGVAFSHEGGMRGGYASQRAAQVLRSLAQHGVDSVALMPFASMSAPDATRIRRYAGESDEALAHMIFVAHQAGMRVMLKPQIWLRGGRFPGDIRFTQEDDYRAWWAEYRQWILHYARLAEREGADLFCAGTELQQVSRREADWRRLIAEIRRVYRGPLTYAANWGSEFESLTFWDALDYLGLDNYYPLAEADGSPPAAALEERARQLAARVEAVSRKWRRPVILTEVGYPSSPGAARQPWREVFEGPIDLDLQARCYEAAFRAFYHHPWLSGMFWWKWPSGGFGGGPEDRSLTPQDKPAALILQSWYRGPRNPPGHPGVSGVDGRGHYLRAIDVGAATR